jgi:hypothetical protein
MKIEYKVLRGAIYRLEVSLDSRSAEFRHFGVKPVGDCYVGFSEDEIGGLGFDFESKEFFLSIQLSNGWVSRVRLCEKIHEVYKLVGEVIQII